MDAGQTAPHAETLWFGVVKQWPYPQTHTPFPAPVKPQTIRSTKRHLDYELYIALEVVKHTSLEECNERGLSLYRKVIEKDKELKYRILGGDMKEIADEADLSEMQSGRSPDDPLKIHFLEMVLEQYFKECVPRGLPYGERESPSNTVIGDIAKIEDGAHEWVEFISGAKKFSPCLEELFTFYEFPEYSDRAGGAAEVCSSEKHVTQFFTETVVPQVVKLGNKIGKHFKYAVDISQTRYANSVSDFTLFKMTDDGTSIVAKGEKKFPSSLHVSSWKDAIEAITRMNKRDKKIWAYAQTIHGMIQYNTDYAFLTNYIHYVFFKKVTYRLTGGFTGVTKVPKKDSIVPGKLFISRPVSYNDPEVPILKALSYFTHLACTSEELLEARQRKEDENETAEAAPTKAIQKPPPRRSPRNHQQPKDGTQGSAFSGRFAGGEQDNTDSMCDDHMMFDVEEKFNMVRDASLVSGASFKGEMIHEWEQEIGWEVLDGIWANCVSEGRGGKVYRGSIRGESCALKLCSLGSRSGIKMMINEFSLYVRLEKLQGVAIPKLLCCQKIGSWMALGTSYIRGHQYQARLDPSGAQKKKAKELLLAIHSNGVLHGDVRGPNLLVSSDEGSVFWIDLGMGAESADELCFAQELKDLDEL